MSSGSYYTWGADWMPVSIRTGADALDRLHRAISQGLQADPGRGMEIGGILLGRTEYAQDSPSTVIVEDIELVESEHRRGSSYVLSEKDRKALARRLRSRARGTALQPVGFFRSHTRRGLYLDNDDFSVIRAYFPEPYAVFLLVRPVPGAASVAGFFFWEEGDMRRGSSYQEFPFDLAHLPLVQAPVAGPPPLEVGPAAAATTMTWRAWTGRAVAALGALKVPAVNWRVAGPIAAALALVASIFEGQAVLTKRGARTPHPEPVRAEPRRMAQASPPLPAVVPDIKPSPLATKGNASLRGSANRRVPLAAIPESVSAPVAGPPDLPPPPALDNPAPPGAPPLAGGPVAASIPAKLEPPPERPRRPSVATVTLEAAPESKVKRFVGKFPGFHRLEKQRAGYVPARPIREFAPVVPTHVAGAVPVDVRVTVNKTGHVSSLEISRAADRHLMKLAADAAQRWQFEPARVNDEIVTSEMILHFTFRRTRAEP